MAKSNDVKSADKSVTPRKPPKPPGIVNGDWLRQIPLRWALPLIVLTWAIALSAVGCLVAGIVILAIAIPGQKAGLAAWGGALLALPVRSMLKAIRAWAKRTG